MQKNSEREEGFGAGSVVLVTLHSPRQKVVGRLLWLAPEGVALRCVDLESLEDLARLLREGEPAAAATVFYPMHRVERMELDEPSGALPSLAQDFAAKAGCPLEELLCAGQVQAEGYKTTAKTMATEPQR
jgi:hypothetical protein